MCHVLIIQCTSLTIIQLLITISYTIAVNLGTPDLASDQAFYINQVFRVEEFNILTSVLAFILSHCLLIYIYNTFKRFGKILSGTVIGLLGALFLNSVIFITLTLRGNDFMYIIDVLLGNVIMNIFMIIIITALFYIIKGSKREEIVIKDEIKDVNDLVIEEVISKKDKTKTNNSKTTKKNNYKNNSSNKKSNSTKSSTKKTTKKNENKKTSSKKNVNKENK